MKKWIAIYCGHEWTHAWILEAVSEKDAEGKARSEILAAFASGAIGSNLDEGRGEWIEVRPMASTFLETTS